MMYGSHILIEDRDLQDFKRIDMLDGKNFDDWGRLTCEDVDKTTTQDELDFALKRDLRMTPEERYQLGKRSFLFHDLSCYLRDLSDEEYGCTGARCIPECRFYPEYGPS